MPKFSTLGQVPVCRQQTGYDNSTFLQINRGPRRPWPSYNVVTFPSNNVLWGKKDDRLYVSGGMVMVRCTSVWITRVVVGVGVGHVIERNAGAMIMVLLLHVHVFRARCITRWGDTRTRSPRVLVFQWLCIRSDDICGPFFFEKKKKSWDNQAHFHKTRE